MISLDTLEHSHFTRLIDQTFTVSVAGQAVPLELVEAKLLGHRRTEAARDPFALTFRGAHGLRLPQGIYLFGHGAMGSMEIFIAQIGDGAKGSLFEAVFT